VEDNRTARAHLANLLQHWGALAEEAASGAEALRLLGGDGDGPRYEAALVDMTLEEGGGLALLARIRQLPAKRQPAVVLLTGLRYRGREAHLRQLGAYEGLCKPVRESKLLVTLERIQGRPQAATAGAPEAPAESDAGNCGCHILVVDDNRVNLKVAATLLARMGYSVATATNGREAVEAVAEGQYKMVLMDCQMPVMDGFAATAAIRRLDESVRNVPIVAVTANAMSGDRERCLRSKPIRKDQLREILGRLCTSDQPAETASEEPSPAGRSG
jgi:two-component system, sensor histidine kinase and response regulator